MNRKAWWGVYLVSVVVLLGACAKPAEKAAEAGEKPAERPVEKAGEKELPPLTIAVMDPLAAPLACTCVKGYAQRHYEALAQYLTRQLKRPFRVVFGEDLSRLMQDPESGTVALAIGKQSVVRFDAGKLQLPLRVLARLTDREGKSTVRGLFVVRRDDPAKQLADLQGYKILLGPAESTEKHAAALESLLVAGVTVAPPFSTTPACSDGALQVVESPAGTKIATVISSYAIPLLEGCGTVEKGALRVLGTTADVPFVTLFATDRCPAELDEPLRAALQAVRNDQALLALLESRDGFEPVAATASP